MKKKLDYIVSLSMAVLILTASMGFTLNKHFCAGELKEIALNKKTIACSMHSEQKVKPVQACPIKASKHEKGCCEDEQDELKTGDYNLAKKIEGDTQNDYQFIAFSYVVLTSLHSSNSLIQLTFNDYSPPLIDHDIPVEIQSFLL